MTNPNEETQMTNPQASLFTRPDTFFGVCQGLSEDVGIHANLFRVAFGMAFFFAPLATLATYFALGLVVLAIRTALPVPTLAAPTADVAALVVSAAVIEDQGELQLAA